MKEMPLRIIIFSYYFCDLVYTKESLSQSYLFLDLRVCTEIKRKALSLNSSLRATPI